LNIADTLIDDEGLRHLEGIASLKKLIVTGSKVTQTGLDRLKKALPELEIVTTERHVRL
jgi:hypothetical protein